MKRLFGRVMLFILVVLVAAAWAEERRYEVTITLTRAQLNAVNNARGRSVTVEFTADQIKTIQQVLPGFDLTDVKLTTAHLDRDNQVLLVLLAPDDVHGRISMDPQPSP
jgi:hypothetical protein